MNEIRSLRSLLVWIVPFAIVLAVLGWETDWGGGVSLPVPVAAPAAPQPVNVALTPEYRIDGGLAARNETVDRVLFNPTRRPAPPAAQAASGPSALAKGKYALTGTIVVGDVVTAFLREVATGKPYTVHKGEKIDGAMVAEAAPDHVRLTLGADSEDLPLKVAQGPKTTVLAPHAGIPGVPQPARGAGALGIPQPVVPQAGAGPLSVGEVLARRRAAAAAQAAAQARATVAPAAANANPGAVDPRWGEADAAIRARIQAQRTQTQK